MKNEGKFCKRFELTANLLTVLAADCVPVAGAETSREGSMEPPPAVLIFYYLVFNVDGFL
jgi:hypothetical protein